MQVCICVFPIATGAASRLISGYDSYGNTCGKNNSKVEGVPLSGQDMRENRLVSSVTEHVTQMFTYFIFTCLPYEEGTFSYRFST